MKKLFLLCWLFVSSIAYTQTDWACATSTALPDNSNREANCSNMSDTYKNHYRTPKHWIPNFYLTPLKTVKVNFIVCHALDGSGGTPNTSVNNAKFYDLVDSINHYYANSHPKGYPSTCPISYGYATDSRIRFSLEAIHHVSNQSMYMVANHGAKKNAIQYVHNNFSGSDEVMNVFFVNDTAFASAAGEYVSVTLNNGETHCAVFTESPTSTGAIIEEFRIGHMVHEFGHSLGLGHTYDGGEPRSIHHFDFLGDVWGNCAEPLMADANNPCFSNCPNSSPCPCNEGIDTVCHLLANCFFNNFDGANPLMSGKIPARYISPLQMGRFHRSLSLFDNEYVMFNKNMHRYVKEKYPFQYAYHINTDETWDFGIKMYQDIVVKEGNTLEITCEVRMPINGKIIVEKGAKLIVNGGKITCAHEGEQWQGIEVWGQNNFNQTGVYQGVVEIKNDAIIEHANVAVALWKPFQWSQTGGIIKAENSLFLNNRKSVEFIHYLRYKTNGLPKPNVSSFRNVRFIWDDDLGQMTHLIMSRFIKYMALILKGVILEMIELHQLPNG